MKSLFFLLTALLILSCKKKDSIEKEIDAFLKGQQELFSFNGNVLIADRGKIIYQKSFGYADYDSNQKLNDSSIFDLASVNKQFTAMGILILIEKGQLKLTDSLRHFLPELPYKGVTIHHMLTHTSGLPDYLRNMIPGWDHSKVAFNNDMIDFLIREKLSVYFRPGEKFAYCNTGYVLLASIIEKVSGKSYGDFLQENIFKPLKMNHSYVYNARRSSEARIPNYAYGFEYSDSLKRYVMPESLPGYTWLTSLDGTKGEKGVNTTTGDLFKWDRALRENQLVSSETMAKMNTPYAIMDTTNRISYGYGVQLGKNDLGNYIMHSGGSPGMRTFLINYPGEDRTFIVLSNNCSGSIDIANTLTWIVYGRKVLMPYQHKKIKIDPAALDNFCGTFKTKGKTYRFIREKTHLYRYASGSGKGVEFLPESETKIFTSERLDLQFETEKGSDDKTRFYQILYGVKKEVEKTDLY